MTDLHCITFSTLIGFLFSRQIFLFNSLILGNYIIQKVPVLNVKIMKYEHYVIWKPLKYYLKHIMNYKYINVDWHIMSTCQGITTNVLCKHIFPLFPCPFLDKPCNATWHGDDHGITWDHCATTHTPCAPTFQWNNTVLLLSQWRNILFILIT